MNITRILLGTQNPEGRDRITNGQFLQDLSGWNVSGSTNSFYWSANRMYMSGGTTGTTRQTTIVGNVLETYKVRFFVSVVDAGTLIMFYGGYTFYYTTSGWKEETITVSPASTPTTIVFNKSAGLSGYIDNVSLIRYGGYVPYSYQEVDIYNDDDVRLNFARQDVSTLGTRNTSFSRTLELPGTINNDNIFNMLFDLSVKDTDKYLNKRIPALVYYGDSEILNGEAELTSVNINHSSNESKYNIVLRDTIITFTQNLGDKFIVDNIDLADDIDFSEYNHTFSTTNILNSWSTNFNATASTVTFGSGYFYPLLNTYGNQTQDFEWTQFRPAIYAKELFDKIVAKAGYTYSSTFLNSDNFKQMCIPYTDVIESSPDDLLKRQFRAGLTADINKIISGKISQDGYQRMTMANTWASSFGKGVTKFRFTSPGSPQDIYTSTGYFSNETSYDFSDISNLYGFNSASQVKGQAYVVPATGNYQFGFKTEFNVHFLDSNRSAAVYTNLLGSRTKVTFSINRLRNGAVKTIASETTIVNHSGSFVDPNNGNPFYVVKTWSPTQIQVVSMGEAEEFLAGDIVYIEVTLDTSEVKVTSAGGQSILKQVVSLTFYKASTISTEPGTVFFVQAKSASLLYLGDTVNMNLFLPKKTTQIDYFTDILTLFNLTVDTDPLDPKHLIIDTRYNYLSSGTTKDWSLLLDRAQDISIQRVPTLIDKNVNFTYLQDTDDLNTKYQNYFNESYGDWLVLNDTKTDDTYDISLNVFSPTPCALIPNTNIIIGQIYETSNGESNPVRHNLRILYRNDIIKNATSLITTTSPTSNNYIQILDRFTGAKTTIGTWFTTATQFDNPYNAYYDLNWGYSKQYYNNFYNTPPLPPYNNLYQTYYKDYIDSIIDVDAKLIAAYFKLDEYEISTLRFNNQINIDGNWYLINKIVDWNPNYLTYVELIKILESNIPTSTSGKTSSTLVLINNLDNIESKIKTKVTPQFGALPLSSAVVPSNELPSSLSYPLFPNSGDTVDTYSAFTETISVVEPSVVSPLSNGVVQGNGNSINARNFFVSGWDNNISNSRNISINGTNNTILGGNTNITLNSSNNTIAGGINDVAIIGSSISGNTITQSNTTLIAGNIILSSKPIQSLINVIDGSPSMFSNIIKNINIIDGDRPLSSHTLGRNDDVTHVVDGEEKNSLPKIQ